MPVSVSWGGLILIAASAICTCVYFNLLPLLTDIGECPGPGELVQPGLCGIIFNKSTSYLGYWGRRCANPSYEVVCENNKAVMYFNYGEIPGHADAVIAVNSSTFRYIATGVDPNNCSFIDYSLSMPHENVSFFADRPDWDPLYLTVVRCEKPVLNVDGYMDIDSGHCGNNGIKEKQQQHYYYSYALPGDGEGEARDIAESCSIEMKVMMGTLEAVRCGGNCSYPEIHSERVNGIELRWRPTRCQDGEPNLERERVPLGPLRCILMQASFICLRIGSLRKSEIADSNKLHVHSLSQKKKLTYPYLINIKLNSISPN